MDARRRLERIYRKLDDHFGNLNWWPGDAPFEIIVGAILTQNTSWSNVEKAIQNLKKRNLLSPRRLQKVCDEEIADLIRPSGYYNLKSRRLRHFLDFLSSEYGNSLEKMFSEEVFSLRNKLLAVKGIGKETADSILLYAGGEPVFVIDAYTRRILERHGLVSAGSSYDDMQRLFMENLPPSVALFNQYHALIVNAGKYFCRKTPLCSECPLKSPLT